MFSNFYFFQFWGINLFLFIHIRIKCVPICRIASVFYRHWRIEPVACVIVVYDDATFQMLVDVFLRLHVFEEGIVLLGSIGVAVLGLCVEEEDLTIVHADDEIHIEERFLALAVGVGNGIVFATLVAILIPPVNRVAMGFEEGGKLLFGDGCSAEFDEGDEGMVFHLVPYHVVF